MKVCHISTVHNVFDDRIFHKECVSLAKNGFDVTLIAKHHRSETIDEVKICALPIKNSRLFRIVLQAMVFFNAIKINAKSYHFHDPELMFLGVILRIIGKKVIYDVHEDITKQILYKNWIKFAIIRTILSKIVHYLEKFCAMFFTRIIVVTDDIAANFDSRKTILIRNFPIVELIDKASSNNNNETKTILIYVGGLTGVRGIKEIISALDYLSNDIELHILGPWDSDSYRQLCMSLPSWSKAKYMGALKLEDVYPFIKAADIGISLLYPAKNYIKSLPVKAFEYMACEKPMIMSDFIYWKEVFGDVALFCDPMNPKEIASCVKQLAGDKNKANTMAKEGRKLILEKFSWEAESKQLIEMYNNL
jgi:glycosyltransferase involved in cell wall biosynthesis